MTPGAGTRAWRLSRFGLEHLALETRPAPAPGPGEALVRTEAVSLNRRDLLLVEGTYNPKQPLPVTPCTDAAGIVEAVGAGVAHVKVGDAVHIGFFPGWIGGSATNEGLATSRAGQGGDGLLAERFLYPADALHPNPPHLSAAEAATLPCAAVTAWSAIVSLGRVQPGDVVLVEGTGGVALFALQFAKLAGARVIVTSSSAGKLEAARRLGADAGIDYVAEPRWGEAARKVFGRIDHVVEIGGAATLETALRAVRPGGTISLVGVLGGATAPLNLPLAVMRQVRLQGVTVGSAEDHAAMLRAIAAHRLRPPVGAVFPFAEAPQAFRAMAANSAFGKIVITVP